MCLLNRGGKNEMEQVPCHMRKVGVGGVEISATAHRSYCGTVDGDAIVKIVFSLSTQHESFRCDQKHHTLPNLISTLEQEVFKALEALEEVLCKYLTFRFILGAAQSYLTSEWWRIRNPYHQRRPVSLAPSNGSMLNKMYCSSVFVVPNPEEDEVRSSSDASVYWQGLVEDIRISRGDGEKEDMVRHNWGLYFTALVPDGARCPTPWCKQNVSSLAWLFHSNPNNLSYSPVAKIAPTEQIKSNWSSIEDCLVIEGAMAVWYLIASTDQEPSFQQNPMCFILTIHGSTCWSLTATITFIDGRSNSAPIP